MYSDVKEPPHQQEDGGVFAGENQRVRGLLHFASKKHSSQRRRPKVGAHESQQRALRKGSSQLMLAPPSLQRMSKGTSGLYGFHSKKAGADEDSSSGGGGGGGGSSSEENSDSDYEPQAPKIARKKSYKREHVEILKMVEDNVKTKVQLEELRNELLTGKIPTVIDHRLARIIDKSMKSDLIYKQGSWLARRGYISDCQAKRERYMNMKKCFGFLDTDNSAGVGVDDLLDPLISLGLAQSREDVAALIARAEPKGGQEINFEDYLSMLLQRRYNNQQDAAAYAAGADKARRDRDSARSKLSVLFQQLATDELIKGDLSFPLLMTAHRRRLLLAANCAPKGSQQRAEGKTILDALQKLREEDDEEPKAAPKRVSLNASGRQRRSSLLRMSS